MNNETANLLNIVQTVGIVATIVITLWQIISSNKDRNSNTYTSIMERWSEANSVLVEHGEIGEILRTSLYDPNNHTKGHIQCKAFMDIVFGLFDEIYTQHKHFKLIPASEWNDWAVSLVDTFDEFNPYMLDYWNKGIKVHGHYNAEFINQIDTLLKAKQKTN